MSTKSIMSPEAEERAITRQVQVELECTELCAVCEKLVHPKSIYTHLGDLNICYTCGPENGVKLAKMVFLMRALSQLPCEKRVGAARYAATDVTGGVRWLKARRTIRLSCKCVPCQARNIYYSDPTNFGEGVTRGQLQRRWRR